MRSSEKPAGDSTRKKKIRIILEGLKAEDSIANICRREGISPTMYYKWSKAFLEAGKQRLQGDTLREASIGTILQPCPFGVGRIRYSTGGDGCRILFLYLSILPNLPQQNGGFSNLLESPPLL